MVPFFNVHLGDDVVGTLSQILSIFLSSDPLSPYSCCNFINNVQFFLVKLCHHTIPLCMFIQIVIEIELTNSESR